MLIHQLEVLVFRGRKPGSGGAGVEVLGGKRATARARPDDWGEETGAEYDVHLGVFFFADLEPGFYHLTVEHPEYQSQVRKVQVHPRPTQIVFRLVAAEDAFIHCGRGEVPYLADSSLVGLIPQPDATRESVEALCSDLGFALESEVSSVPHPAYVARRSPEVSENRLADLRASALIATAGPVFRDSSNDLAILTSRLFIRFRVDVGREEAAEILQRQEQALRVVEGPLGYSVNLYLIEASAETGAEINVIAGDLMALEAVDYVEPDFGIVAEGDGPAPNAFLGPGLWDRNQAAVPSAWELLRACRGEDFALGDPEIALAIVDLGLKTRDGRPEHPEFSGRLTNGQFKTRELYDFRKGRKGNPSAKKGVHGSQVAGVASGKTLGVAPNTSLMSAVAPETASELNKAFLWAAGRASEASLQPETKADVVVSAYAYIRATLCLESAQDMLSHLTLRGRLGKGCPVFCSAGNTEENVAWGRPIAWFERSLCCAASTLRKGRERAASYSGTGRLDWCAPSSSEHGGSWQPPDSWTTWTTTFPGTGDLPTVPAFRTRLLQRAKAGAGSLLLETTSGLERGMSILIGHPGRVPSEIAEISRVEEHKVNLVSDLQCYFPKWTAVIAGARWLTRLKEPAAPGARRVFVDHPERVEAGHRLLLWHRSAVTDALVRESVTIQGVANRETGEVEVSELAGRYEEPTEVLQGAYDHCSKFGGTSSAAALCGGIGALVLSANPQLTWVEVRELLRQSAVKIGINKQWRNRSGKPARRVSERVYSPQFGYGRLDAAAAVAAALAYTFPRDLMIRNVPGDDGEQTTERSGDSPDLWIRSQAPAREGGLRDLAYDAPAPHEPPRIGQNHWIYARIFNRGTEPSFDAWVRFSVAVVREERLFYHPKDWQASNGVRNHSQGHWEEGTYFIGEVALPHIEGRQHTIVNIPWPKKLLPLLEAVEGKSWLSYLLVEITPLDGPLQGDHVYNNSNLAQRRLESLG